MFPDGKERITCHDLTRDFLIYATDVRELLAIVYYARLLLFRTISFPGFVLFFFNIFFWFFSCSVQRYIVKSRHLCLVGGAIKVSVD